jgi:hypothetical protein
MFPIPDDSGSPGRAHARLLQVRKSLEVPPFEGFLRRLSGSSNLRLVCYPAAACPVDTGRAAILRTMLPNSRRVR